MGLKSLVNPFQGAQSCEKVSDLGSTVDFPSVPHYDTCFGVVSRYAEQVINKV